MNVFITCTSEKASHRCKAKDMYTSALFKKVLGVCSDLKS